MGGVRASFGRLELFWRLEGFDQDNLASFRKLERFLAVTMVGSR